MAARRPTAGGGLQRLSVEGGPPQWAGNGEPERALGRGYTPRVALNGQNAHVDGSHQTAAKPFLPLFAVVRLSIYELERPAKPQTLPLSALFFPFSTNLPNAANNAPLATSQALKSSAKKQLGRSRSLALLGRYTTGTGPILPKNHVHFDQPFTPASLCRLSFKPQADNSTPFQRSAFQPPLSFQRPVRRSPMSPVLFPLNAQRLTQDAAALPPAGQQVFSRCQAATTDNTCGQLLRA